MNLGNEIRKRRKEEKLTINELSKKTGFSVGYLSNIERNISSPTIESLRIIVDTLSTSLVDLFNDQKYDTRVIRKDKRTTLLNSLDDKILYQLISPSNNTKLQAMITTFEPGAESGNKPHQHNGEEIGYIIKGQLYYKVDDEEYILNEGDSICYDSNAPHLYKNISDEVCISLWIVTPPSF